MSRRKIAGALVLSVLALGSLAASQARVEKKRPALVDLGIESPRLLSPSRPTAVSPEDQTAWKKLQLAHAYSRRVVRRTAENPAVAKLRLNEDQIRAGITIVLEPNSSLMTIDFDSGNREVDRVVADAHAESFVADRIEEGRREQLDRLDKLRKLWDTYQSQIRAKQSALASLRAAADAVPVDAETDKRRAAEQLLALDRIAVQTVVLKHRLGAAKKPDAEIDALKAELATLDVERKAREELLVELGRRKALDTTQETEEIRLAVSQARKIGDQVEALEVELQAPPRYRVVAKAE